MEGPKELGPSTRETERARLERGLQFLQTVELEYRNGTRTKRELLFFANKVQGLFFDAVHTLEGSGPVRPYDEHASLTTLPSEDATELYWTEFKNSQSEYPVAHIASGEEIDTTEQELQDLLRGLKAKLSAAVVTYRTQFGASSVYLQDAQTVLQNADAAPSEIITATHDLVTLLYQ